MVRLNDKGGIEYAIRRNEDDAWLYDGDLDGTDTAWEPDADNATWFETREEALAVADIDGLVSDDDYALAPGYSFWERNWINEEDLTEDYVSPAPRPSKD